FHKNRARSPSNQGRFFSARSSLIHSLLKTSNVELIFMTELFQIAHSGHRFFAHGKAQGEAGMTSFGLRNTGLHSATPNTPNLSRRPKLTFRPAAAIVLRLPAVFRQFGDQSQRDGQFVKLEVGSEKCDGFVNAGFAGDLYNLHFGV